jgi:hypothetical protein
MVMCFSLQGRIGLMMGCDLNLVALQVWVLMNGEGEIE